MRKELLIGCGKDRKKIIRIAESPETFGEGLVTLDINPDRNPDVVWDLENLPLPFEDDTFDEIHAYQVLEHIGRQGDYKQFFAMFTEFWRIMKKGGAFCCSFPMWNNIWAFGDPSHTRVLCPQQFQFLSQKFMADEVERGSMASDFRYIYKADFNLVWINEDSMSNYLALEAVK
jgi:SAM-dependent methyltransferase